MGDLEVAEDAVQDACAAALAQWPADGSPASPRSWLIGTARHKALDRLRREHRRAEKEAEAVRERDASPPPGGWVASTDDELGLINMKGRIYDPNAAHFLTPDPITSEPSSARSWNRYSYVYNNPMTLTDLPARWQGATRADVNKM